MDKATKEPTEIGSGYIDFKPILRQPQIGMKYSLLSRTRRQKPRENVTNDYNNLKKVLS